MNYWLIKSEPYKYSWEQFLQDKKTMWDGVRNYQARNNLISMRKGDQAFFYHSNEGLCIVGIAEVVKEHYPDPTEKGEHSWVVVDFKPVQSFKRPVTLPEIKIHPQLSQIALVRQGRLSVCPITPIEWEIVLKMGK